MIFPAAWCVNAILETKRESPANSLLRMKILHSDLGGLDRIYRLNIINSISGVKPANLIGTVSGDGTPNLAVFSSVMHLGSDPALLGMIVRPAGKLPRNTYENIIDTGHYTINHIQ